MINKRHRSVVDFETEEDLRKALMGSDLLDEASSEQEWILSMVDSETTEVQSVEKELRRLQALKSYLILDSEREEAFDRLTGLAARSFRVPVAFISFVDLGRVWFMSNRGLGDLREGPRKDSFCAHAIEHKHNVFIVKDATRDPRFVNHFLVVGSANIRFYAAVPLISPEGYKLGTFCIIDTVPRPAGLSQDELLSLRDFAELAMKEVVERRRNLKQNQSPAQVIAYMAHDLMTPLTGIRLSLSLLNEDEEIKDRISFHQQELLSTAANCSDLMVRICQTSMEGLRSESMACYPDGVSSNKRGSKPVTKISELVSRLARIMDPIAKSVPLVITVDPNVPPVVVTDELKLLRAALNLISNGISRATVGLVHFRVYVKPEDSTRIIFDCTDTGPDIELEEYDHMFRPRLPAEGSLSLGLSSVAFLIKSLNGEYGFLPLHKNNDGGSSVVPRGVSFWFGIPLLTPEVLGVNSEEELPVSVLEKIGSTTKVSMTSRVLTETATTPAVRDPRTSARCGGLPDSFAIPVLGKYSSSSRNSVMDPGGNVSCGVGRGWKNSSNSIVQDDPVFHRIPVLVNDQREYNSAECSFLPNSRDHLNPSRNYKLVRHPSSTTFTKGPIKHSIAASMMSTREKRRVLIIDDSFMIRKTLSSALEKLSFNVSQAANGLEGLEKMKEQMFDFVLCDFVMPVMDGFDCVAQYREWEKLNRPNFHQYIVGISAHTEADYGKKGCRAGMDDYRPKPISVKELTEIQKANQVVSNVRQLAEIEQANDDLHSEFLSAGYLLEPDQAQFSESVHAQSDSRMVQCNFSHGTKRAIMGSLSSHDSVVMQPSKLQKLDVGNVISGDQGSRACLIATGEIHGYDEVFTTLEQKGWTVVVTGDGADALRLLKMRNWSTVLIDDDFPLLNGVDCTKELRVWERDNRVGRQGNVYLVCKGHVASVLEKSSIVQPPTGFDGVLGKPVNWNQLNDMLDMKKEQSFDVVVEGRFETSPGKVASCQLPTDQNLFQEAQ